MENNSPIGAAFWSFLETFSTQVIGLVLGIMARTEKDIFKLFPNLGIILNLIAFIFVIFIILLGIGVL